MAKKPTPVSETISAPSTDVRALPPRVQEMREAILAAVQARDIEALRPAIERNETLPIFASGPQRPKTFAQAVDFLRSRSQDKKGAEILHVLEAIFAQPYVKSARGQSVTYVWPAFTLTQKAPATEEELAQQWRCVMFSSLAGNLDKPVAVQRIGIGADGTWHYFWGGLGE
jgi:hypothetical protein